MSTGRKEKRREREKYDVKREHEGHSSSLDLAVWNYPPSPKLFCNCKTSFLSFLNMLSCGWNIVLHFQNMKIHQCYISPMSHRIRLLLRQFCYHRYHQSQNLSASIMNVFFQDINKAVMKMIVIIAHLADVHESKDCRTTIISIVITFTPIIYSLDSAFFCIASWRIFFLALRRFLRNLGSIPFKDLCLLDFGFLIPWRWALYDWLWAVWFFDFAIW